jgi:hypothetical protein
MIASGTGTLLRDRVPLSLDRFLNCSNAWWTVGVGTGSGSNQGLGVMGMLMIGLSEQLVGHFSATMKKIWKSDEL